MFKFIKFFLTALIISSFAIPSISFALGDDGEDGASDNGSCVNLTKDLSIGSRTTPRSTDANSNGEVSELQSFLKEEIPFFKYVVTSGRFGTNTYKAVKAFQSKIYSNIDENDATLVSFISNASDRHEIATSGFLLTSSGTVRKYTRAKIAYVSCKGTDNSSDSVNITSTNNSQTSSTVNKNTTNANTSLYYLSENNNYLVINNNNVTIAGGLTKDTVKINSGISGVIVDSNVDKVEFPNNYNNYKIVYVSGKGLQVQLLSGVVILKTTSLNQPISLVFNDGTHSLTQTSISGFFVDGSAVPVVNDDSVKDVINSSSNSGTTNTYQTVNSGALPEIPVFSFDKTSISQTEFTTLKYRFWAADRQSEANMGCNVNVYDPVKNTTMAWNSMIGAQENTKIFSARDYPSGAMVTVSCVTSKGQVKKSAEFKVVNEKLDNLTITTENSTTNSTNLSRASALYLCDNEINQKKPTYATCKWGTEVIKTYGNVPSSVQSQNYQSSTISTPKTCMFIKGSTWMVGGSTCSASVNTSVTAGNSVTAYDINGRGSISGTCGNDGQWISSSITQTCSPVSSVTPVSKTCTFAKGSTWTVGGSSCSASTDTSVSSGNYAVGYDINGRGSISGTCDSNGNWTNVTQTCASSVSSVQSSVSPTITSSTAISVIKGTTANTTISWSAVNGARNYNYRLDKGAAANLGSITSWTGNLGGLDIGNHTIEVQSCNSNSICSDWSNTLNITVGAAPH